MRAGELQQLAKTAAEERLAALILDRSSGFLHVLSPPFSFFRALRSFQIRFCGVAGDNLNIATCNGCTPHFLNFSSSCSKKTFFEIVDIK
jgi:hypothetical protein